MITLLFGCLDSEGTPHSRGSVLMFLPGKFNLVRNLLFWVNFDVGLIMLKTHPEVHQFVLIIWKFVLVCFLSQVILKLNRWTACWMICWEIASKWNAHVKMLLLVLLLLTLILLLLFIITSDDWKTSCCELKSSLKARQSCLLLQLFSGLVWMLFHLAYFFKKPPFNDLYL